MLFLIFLMDLYKSFPSDFEKLVNLKTLFLNDNKLIRLPEYFGQLSQLTSLTLTNNRLVSLSPDFGNLHLNIWIWVSISSRIFHRLLVYWMYPQWFSHTMILNPYHLVLGNISLTTLTIVDNRAPLTLSPDFGNLANLTTLIITNSKLLWFPSTLTVPPQWSEETDDDWFFLAIKSAHFWSVRWNGESCYLTINNNIVPPTLSPDFGKLANLVTLTITNSKLLWFLRLSPCSTEWIKEARSY